ncbi:MAG: hypothetical protein ACTHJJ_13975 [Intrasporangium sp.]|uniref:hypothetical protein n=1 Tax=Intrasporangium sp. TaxID=1925024 RepID=UPI003F81DE81
MATWDDVDRMAGRLPGAVLGAAHEGSPAWYAGRHPFARLRWDDEDRQLVQVWSGEMDLADAVADRRDTFPHVATFRYRVTLWALLDRLDRAELAELLLDSYDIRGGRRRRGDVDVVDLLA